MNNMELALADLEREIAILQNDGNYLSAVAIDSCRALILEEWVREVGKAQIIGCDGGVLKICLDFESALDYCKRKLRVNSTSNEHDFDNQRQFKNVYTDTGVYRIEWRTKK